jgi:hypothetical protein
LEAFQVGFIVDYGRYINLETIKKKILDEFKKAVTQESFLEALMDDSNLSFENDEKRQFLTSSSWFDPTLEKINVNAFRLINYLENGAFNNDVVDFVPKLLSSGFNCKLNLFQYDLDADKKDSFDSALGKLYLSEEFWPTIKTSEDSKSSSIQEISIIYLRNQMHYVAKTKNKLTSNNILRLKNDTKNTISIIPAILQDNFYSEIAKNFQKSKILIFTIFGEVKIFNIQ